MPQSNRMQNLPSPAKWLLNVNILPANQSVNYYCVSLVKQMSGANFAQSGLSWDTEQDVESLTIKMLHQSKNTLILVSGDYKTMWWKDRLEWLSEQYSCSYHPPVWTDKGWVHALGQIYTQTVLWLNKKHKSHLWRGLIKLYFNVEMISSLSKIQTWCKWFSCWLCQGITIQDVPKAWGELCMSFLKNVHPWHTHQLPAWLFFVNPLFSPRNNTCCLVTIFSTITCYCFPKSFLFRPYLFLTKPSLVLM